MSTSVFSDLFGVDFVMASAGLLSPAIYRTSESSRRSYDYRIIIISIIRRFSRVIPSLIIYSYNEKKSVQTIVGIAGKSSYLIIKASVVAINIPISTPPAIA